MRNKSHIDAKDLQKMYGWSVATAYRRLREARLYLKKRHKRLTFKEYAQYEETTEEELRSLLYGKK